MFSRSHSYHYTYIKSLARIKGLATSTRLDRSISQQLDLIFEVGIMRMDLLFPLGYVLS